MYCYKQLMRGVVIALMLIFLAGCGKSKNAALYTALPINTDGNPTGTIVLVEFLDYADPACLKMATTINGLMEKRPNVRIIYHPIVANPKKAYFTELVLAASLQNRFLAAHHLMINASTKLTEKQTVELLSQAFIDTNAMQREEKGVEVRSMLNSNEKLAKIWGVTTLPTFFIGRLDHTPVMLVGPQTLKQLLAAIDEEN